MKQTVIFGFITIGVLLLASSAFADDEEYDITGRWYVTGVKGAKIPFQYRCWAIGVASTDLKTFSVKSSFQHAPTGEWYGIRIFINRDDKTIQARNQYHELAGTGRTYAGDEIVIDGAQFWVDKQEEVAVIRNIITNGVESQYWEELYLHRRRHVLPADLPLADQLVDNLYC